MKKVIFLSATALLFSLTTMAQSTDLAKTDKQSDMKDLRKDMKDESKDKKERKKELKEGDKKDAKALNKDIKADKKDIKADKKDLRNDGVKEPGEKAKKQIHTEHKEHPKKHG